MRRGNISNPNPRTMPKEHRKFGGKFYIFHHFYSKTEGETKAANLRKNAGVLVRLVPYGKVYALYLRNPSR